MVIVNFLFASVLCVFSDYGAFSLCVLIMVLVLKLVTSSFETYVFKVGKGHFIIHLQSQRNSAFFFIFPARPVSMIFLRFPRNMTLFNFLQKFVG